MKQADSGKKGVSLGVRECANTRARRTAGGNEERERVGRDQTSPRI